MIPGPHDQVFSLFSFNSSSITFSEILKSVSNRLSIIGLTAIITPTCFALVITPRVPVNLRFNFPANFQAFKSSNKSKELSISLARAIALASPESI
jgi:hypothetical protein